VIPIAIVVAGCGLFGLADSPKPPTVFVNLVAGHPVTWCIAGTCSDGPIRDLDALPRVSAPYQLHLPQGSRVESVSVWDALGVGATVTPVPFTEDSFGPVPEDAVMVGVFVKLPGPDHAIYYWALERPRD
jgi:hypothetical protein